MSVQVFICHASKDMEIARVFVELVENVFHVQNDEIRCSSLKGYGFNGDDFLTNEMKRDIAQAKVVIALVSWASLDSPYVWAELGAAWCQGKPLVLCFIPGTAPEHLGGPWIERLYCDFNEPNQMAGIVDQIKKCGIEAKALNDAKKVDDYARFEARIRAATNSRVLSDKIVERRALIADQSIRLSWGAISEYVKSELIVIGWSNHNVITAKSSHHFKRILEKGVKVTFLIQDPVALGNCSQLSYGHICGKNTNGEILEDIRDAIDKFKKSSESTFSDLTGFRVLKTTELLAWSCVAVDRDLGSGIIQLEIYSYGADAESRPNIVIRPNSACYSNINESISRIFRRAESI